MLYFEHVKLPFHYELGEEGQIEIQPHSTCFSLEQDNDVSKNPHFPCLPGLWKFALFFMSSVNSIIRAAISYNNNLIILHPFAHMK